MRHKLWVIFDWWNHGKAYWDSSKNESSGFESILRSHMISVITSTKSLPTNITEPKASSIENLTKIINSVTLLMATVEHHTVVVWDRQFTVEKTADQLWKGNVMRMLRDEKNYVKEREIKPVKLECNFQNQQSWENGFLVKETMKELISRFPIKKPTNSKNDSCQQWVVSPPQQFQGSRSIN